MNAASQALKQIREFWNEEEPEPKKKCIKCQELLPLTAFHKVDKARRSRKCKYCGS